MRTHKSTNTYTMHLGALQGVGDEETSGPSVEGPRDTGVGGILGTAWGCTGSSKADLTNWGLELSLAL